MWTPKSSKRSKNINSFSNEKNFKKFKKCGHPILPKEHGIYTS
jgi:hypothetical protein